MIPTTVVLLILLLVLLIDRSENLDLFSLENLQKTPKGSKSPKTPKSPSRRRQFFFQTTNILWNDYPFFEVLRQKLVEYDDYTIIDWIVKE